MLKANLPSRDLRAGSLDVTYAEGAIRRVRIGNREILRHIYFAVRDRHWRTILAGIKGEDITAGEREFTIRLLVEHQEDGIHFVWRGVISGSPNNKIVFSAEGEPQTEFFRSRIGLCVLHPIENCAGSACTIEHSDGTREESHFPQLVSPHQPFFDVQAISYSPLPGLIARVEFRGDLFETEDQRNWSDASFKTYSTPLSIPYPVKVEPGEQVKQEVELSVLGSVPAPSTGDSSRVNIDIDRSRIYPLRAIGVMWDGDNIQNPISHLRVDVRFTNEAWPEAIRKAVECGLPLEIAAFTCDPAADLSELHSVVAQERAKLARVMVFRADGDLSDPEDVAIARWLFPKTPIGGGSCANFAELNRNRAIARGLDFLTWPVNPRVHAVDDETMIENLDGQAPALETARQFAGDRGVCISPVLVPDFPASSGWIASSVKHLFSAGVAAVTYSRSDSILREICELHAEGIVSSSSTNPLIADALILRKAGRDVAWVANFRPEPQDVAVNGKLVALTGYAVVRAELDR